MLLACCCMQIKGKAQTAADAYHRDPVVYIDLMLPSADSMLLVDGTAAMYDNRFSADVDQYDADKLPNFLENICLLRDGKNLAIEARPLPKQNDTLFIKMWQLRKPVYNLQITIKGIPALLGKDAWLIDNYLHTQVPVDFFNKTLYSFSPNTDANSYVNRFMIVLNNDKKQDSISAIAGSIKVFPNPVTGNKISLQFTNMAKDNYKIIVTSLTGRGLLNSNIVHNGGNNIYYLPLNSVMNRGLYTIAISSGDGKKIIHLPVILNN